MGILFYPVFISCFNRGYSALCVPGQYDNSFKSDTNYMFSFSRNSFSFLSLVPCLLDKIDCMALVCPDQDVEKAESNIQTDLKNCTPTERDSVSHLFCNVSRNQGGD